MRRIWWQNRLIESHSWSFHETFEVFEIIPVKPVDGPECHLAADDMDTSDPVPPLQVSVDGSDGGRACLELRHAAKAGG